MHVHTHRHCLLLTAEKYQPDSSFDTLSPSHMPQSHFVCHPLPSQGLYCDIRQLVQFIKEAHGNVFRRVALSALLDSAEKVTAAKKPDEKDDAKHPGPRRYWLISGQKRSQSHYVLPNREQIKFPKNNHVSIPLRP